MCSEAAHFSIAQSAALLGLGQQAVVAVKTDETYRMCTVDLERTLDSLKDQGLIPFLLVATAGTTDYGSIDPLLSLRAIADTRQLWLHVDAAYGGALMLSKQHQSKLAGIELADSITVDFHKLFYQPISCGAFMLKERHNFRWMKLHADYLNPHDEAEHIPNLVGKSLQTTRRFDSLKLYMSLQHIGTNVFGEIIDYTIELSEQFARRLEEHQQFELLHEPEINAVVFRYVPSYIPDHYDADTWSDELNAYLREELLGQGVAVLARTRNKGRACLKVTLLNPETTIADLQFIIDQIITIGRQYHLEEVR